MKYFLLFVTSLIFQFSFTQSYLLQTEPTEMLKIKGTSSLHDWTVIAHEMSGVAPTIERDGDSLFIAAFTIQIPVSQLDGGRGPAMNNKIKKALLSESHPNVLLIREEMTTLICNEEEEQRLMVTLNIAGESKVMNLRISPTVKEGIISLKGNADMKMTDFSINPPSAMFGQIRTHDDVDIEFLLTYGM